MGTVLETVPYRDPTADQFTTRVATINAAAEAATSGGQPSDADLSTIAAINTSTAGVLASDGAGWVSKTYSALKTALSLTKTDVGLANVDNTSDANKPVSTATQTALNAKQGLDSDLTTIAALTPGSGNVMAADGSGWVSKTYASLKTALSLTKTDVGLSNVDNTADTAKPISTAVQIALDGKDAIPAYGTATFSGTGILTTFTIAHGLGGTPTRYVVSPASSIAAALYYVTVDATNLTVTYLVAPGTGTNNISLNWHAWL